MFTFRALHNLYLFRPNQRSPSKSETRRLWTPRLRKCMFSGNFRNPERFPDSSIHEARYRCSRYEEALLRRYLLLVAISTTAFSIDPVSMFSRVVPRCNNLSVASRPPKRERQIERNAKNTILISRDAIRSRDSRNPEYT